MKKTQSFRVSIHGHSPESDGLSSIFELVTAAGRSKIDYFGLADHNTTAGIPTLYREVSAYNRTHDHQIQPVAGVEIKFADSGDIIFSKPGVLDPAFLSWAQHVIAKRESYPTVRAINQAVRHFGAIVTIPHVGAPLAGSVSRGRFVEILKKLTPRVRKQVAVETRNYATQVFWIFTIAREEVIERLVDSFGVARVGYSDFHEAWMVKKQVSVITGLTPTAQTLKKAMRARVVKPSYREPLGFFEWLRLVVTLGQAWLLYKQKYAGWSLPRFRPEPSFATK